MRKSSFGGGRASISGAPLRVINENAPTRGRQSSTSEDRYSFGGGGRLSVAGSKLPVLNQRKSSASASNVFSFLPKSGRPSSGVGVRGRTDIPKDPRPVSDKRYQTQCMKQLLEFLTGNGYPHPISQKLLISPSSKDFFRIFEFIYSRFSKGYKQVPKMEEEVPRVLKMLGYPFGLSKTYLFSAGSPHTWPHLLAALVWMIDLLQMTESIEDHGGIDAFIFQPEDDNFDGISEEKIIFDYCEKTYAAFMAGHDTFEKFDEELEHILRQNYQGGDIEDIIAENARLEQELGLVQQSEEKVKQLQEKIELSKHDAKVIKTYIEDMQHYRKSQEGELQKRKDELEILNSDLQAEREKLAHMQEIYEQQELTPADVERLKAEQNELRHQIEHLEKQIASIEHDNCKVFLQLGGAVGKLDKEVDTYNKVASECKLVPETAELANGKDFKLRTGVSSDIVANFENNIKPMLLLMKKRCANSIHQKKKEHFRLKCEMEQFQEMINERKDAVAQLAEDLANTEKENESMKKMLQSGKKAEEIETLKQEIVQLETMLKQTEARRTKAIEEYQRLNKKLCNKKESVKKQLSEIEENRKIMMDSVNEYLNSWKEPVSGFIKRLEACEKNSHLRISQYKEENKQTDEWIKSLLPN